MISLFNKSADFDITEFYQKNPFCGKKHSEQQRPRSNCSQ